MSCDFRLAGRLSRRAAVRSRKNDRLGARIRTNDIQMISRTLLALVAVGVPLGSAACEAEETGNASDPAAVADSGSERRTGAGGTSLRADSGGEGQGAASGGGGQGAAADGGGQDGASDGGFDSPRATATRAPVRTSAPALQHPPALTEIHSERVARPVPAMAASAATRTRIRTAPLVALEQPAGRPIVLPKSSCWIPTQLST